MPDDDLDRRLHDLVDDLDHAVVLAPAHEARADGARFRRRTRITVGATVVAGIAVTAASITWAAGPDHRGTRVNAGVPTTSATEQCSADPRPRSLPSTGSPGAPLPADPKPTLTPPPVQPPTSTALSSSPTPASPPPATALPSATAGFATGIPLGVQVRPCPTPDGAYAPLSPRALALADLPAVGGGTWRNAAGSWQGRPGGAPNAPGVFCLPTVWAQPGLPVPNAGAGPDTKVTQTGYDLDMGTANGAVSESIADFATEQEAQAVMDMFAKSMRDCPTAQPEATVARVGGPDDAQLWKWDNGSGSYRGYQGFARSGRTVVTVGYLQAGDLPVALDPALVTTALDRAVGGR